MPESVYFDMPTGTTEETRLGRMLGAGRVTATVRSKKSGQHLTVTLKSSAKRDGKWKTVPFNEATHVFIAEDHGSWGSEKVGTYYPETGKLFFTTADPAYRYSAREVLAAACTGINENDKHEIKELDFCGACGLPLTDPVSIERGIGPTCYGHQTGSKHYRGVS